MVFIRIVFITFPAVDLFVCPRFFPSLAAPIIRFPPTTASISLDAIYDDFDNVYNGWRRIVKPSLSRRKRGVIAMLRFNFKKKKRFFFSSTFLWRPNPNGQHAANKKSFQTNI